MFIVFSWMHILMFNHKNIDYQLIRKDGNGLCRQQSVHTLYTYILLLLHISYIIIIIIIMFRTSVLLVRLLDGLIHRILQNKGGEYYTIFAAI